MKYNYPTIKGEPTQEAYTESRDDGELATNKVLVPDGSGSMLLKTLPAVVDALTPIISKADSFQLEPVQHRAYILSTKATAIVVTVPLEATESIDIGFETNIVQRGAGSVTVTPEGGVTINIDVLETLVILSQHNGIILKKVDTNIWLIFGALVLA